MSKAVSDTPLMQQHRAIKQQYPDAILLFRVGDFYETFGEDAIIAARVLGITLTKRNNGSASASELAGFPHHALDTYLHKLVKAGYRVAICDQLEDPKSVKGIVKRGVTELVTPGIATNDKLLDQNSNNFLAALHIQEDQMGIAFLDISTGEFFVAEGNADYMDKLLQSLKPSEVIFQRSHQKQFKELFGPKFYTYHLDSWVFDESFATESLLKHFQTHSLKGFGIEKMSMAITAAGAILYYLKQTEHPHLQHISSVQRMERDDFLWMDRFTIRNLELLHTGYENGHSLIKVMDNTVSAMGARLLHRWMLFPLKDLTKINERLDAVSTWIVNPDLRKSIAECIKRCGDVERLVSKIPLKKISPREVLQLAKGLEQIAIIHKDCAEIPNSYLQQIAQKLDPCTEVMERIFREINEAPPAAANKGNVFNAGIHEELDELRNIASGGKEFLNNIQQREAELTGISSLKINFNNVFGYYLEVTNSQKNKVPAEWIRKQTLANAERYITPELKTYEEKIMGAEDKILAIELDLYDKLLQYLQAFLAPMQMNGHLLAHLDCLICFAENAIQNQYKKPDMHDGVLLELKDSRHPVIEKNLPAGESYVSNDIVLDPEGIQVIILTGPNMSGKSALLRQTALITLMAHMGSFVPVSAAKIPLTDKIFTRVGASDNLSGGESTFMVEMNETASIINNISARSLILLDEIGRGTSTYDGISIAWSIVEHLHGSPAAPKTLFATHYHELNELEAKLPRVKNYHITNKELGNKIIFLRKLAPGGSIHSFGIHVARMAGMPPSLIARANEILEQLEDKQVDENEGSKKPRIQNKPDLGNQLKELAGPKLQLSIFDAHSQTFQDIRKRLEETDINQLTPVEALMKLNEIKNMLK
ncbi:MAG: DNA mismatch repair protein MutS [Chitinophagaceae bacterium BSSC1]|nr:MAG: DNA mismatch repair protein MutS [Chitinophagaceae bacterium BSSC1]